MKVCIFTSVYALAENDRNGSFLVETNRYLKERGVEVHVFAPRLQSILSLRG